MSTYVIGDVQGCFDALMALLDKLRFDDRRDRLFFTGDLLNRGGQSLHVLRWVVAHQKVCQSVLGNHDLSVLHRYHQPGKRPLSEEIAILFAAPDVELLLDWLQNRPLLHRIGATLGGPWWLCHAGIYPLWSAQQAQTEARFSESLIKNHHRAFFANLFGNRPCKPLAASAFKVSTSTDWDDATMDNSTVARMRFAVNAFTRMRFLDNDGCLDFEAKGPPEKHPHLHPWFRFPQRVGVPGTILYGHWSALGLHEENHTICLDTGKVWGGRLTAARLPESQCEQIDFISV